MVIMIHLLGMVFSFHPFVASHWELIKQSRLEFCIVCHATNTFLLWRLYKYTGA